VEHLKTGGFQVWALEQAMNRLPLQQSSNIEAQKLAIVLGNEVEGVQQEVLAYCDGCLEIPQFGMKHSLNVSVAAGMVLWELVRNRLS
jgi:tRNA G18 (ribose-2'-O)-methylase SpoU